MTDLATLKARIRNAAIRVLPDGLRYKCIFDIRSASSNRVYRVSFDTASGCLCWKCSCPGCIRWGDCKHLQAMGLPGRKYGKSLAWANKIEGR